MKHLTNYGQTPNYDYELIGDNIDDVLDAVNTLKFHYGEDNVKIENESGHISGDKISVYVTFSSNIKLRSRSEKPRSNIIRDMNYILEEEMKNVILYKI